MQTPLASAVAALLVRPVVRRRPIPRRRRAAGIVEYLVIIIVVLAIVLAVGVILRTGLSEVATAVIGRLKGEIQGVGTGNP